MGLKSLKNKAYPFRELSFKFNRFLFNFGIRFTIISNMCYNKPYKKEKLC